MKLNLALPTAILFLSFNSIAQKSHVDSLDQEYLNWYNQDIKLNKTMGVSTERAYQELLQGKTPKKKVVVAVIDAGVDINHEDLQGQIWVNEDEIPGNGIDDDKNGYIDDINGWSFLGNSEGKNIVYENLEVTRIMLDDQLKKDHPKAVEQYEEMLSDKEEDQDVFRKFDANYKGAKSLIYKKTGITVTCQDDCKKVQSDDKQVMAAKNYLSFLYTQGVTDNTAEELLNHTAEYLDYYLNVDFNPRQIIGDDINDLKDNNYGNHMLTPRSSHGTGVAGVIAAKRNNGIGINGIAESVEIMVLRAVPDGDERDKDIALSIYYAADNGADIINMSFGKGFSPQKQMVDDALKYASDKGLLIVHASGNESKNLEEESRFPTDLLNDGSTVTNFVNVGASSKEANKNLVGSFSNYGSTNVDLFAPGVSVMTLDTNSTYNVVDGTSFASPIFSGVAALVWSYYPELTASELKEVLLKSAYVPKKPKKVIQPGGTKKDKLKFVELSKTGGVVNAYNAIQMLQLRTATQDATSQVN